MIISQAGHLLTGLLVTSWGVFPTLTECWPYGQTACQFQVVEKTGRKLKYQSTPLCTKSAKQYLKASLIISQNKH